ncbi:uncharacterized protein EV420DRAFT_885421 [Desarmillaria tabescens]|uniref:Uncharacterized protein n=1 Tax=Armillaria tabescens TaxID=1929756 RepID=A0AA39JR53_ARMTA|nr:uncharacterized protein EV420DRAFT_885421 [Desarmillaria tabescens]KAK0446997.1 hypothetical protein EV420DRAFT_885421 [Desarmillaria tabescens]
MLERNISLATSPRSFLLFTPFHTSFACLLCCRITFSCPPSHCRATKSCLCIVLISFPLYYSLTLCCSATALCVPFFALGALYICCPCFW